MIPDWVIWLLTHELVILGSAIVVVIILVALLAVYGGRGKP